RLLGWGRAGGPAPARLILMVQREVGARLVAAPGTKAYGRLTVETAYAANCRKLFEVPPGAFLPRPKVHSVVLELVPRAPALPFAAEAVFHRIVRAAFGQRRKTLANALAEEAGSRGAVEALLAAAGHPAGVRGERLTPSDFVRLAERWATGEEERVNNNVQ
ncbi:MAG: rRNA adenine dimethyltransferase family protein, partial [bacterium]